MHIYTYRSQERFNILQLQATNRGLELQATTAKEQEAANKEQHEANAEQRLAAEAQRETAAVEALGRYLDNPKGPMAWESGEAIIDVMGGESTPQEWKATVRRALYLHPETLNNIECELYSDAFKAFVVSLTTTHKLEDLCDDKARFAPLRKSTNAAGTERQVN